MRGWKHTSMAEEQVVFHSVVHMLSLTAISRLELDAAVNASRNGTAVNLGIIYLLIFSRRMR